MRLRALTLALTLVASVGSAPLASADSTTADAKSATPTFYGRLYAQADGRPMTSGDVQLREAHPPAWRDAAVYGEGSPDANGVYRITLLHNLEPPDGLEVVLVADGDSQAVTTFSGGAMRESRAQTFRFKHGMSQRVDFHMAPCSYVYIRYVDENGEGQHLGDFPQANLYWERTGERVETPIQNFTSYATFLCLPPGKFSVHVVTPGYVGNPAAEGDAWYPGVPDQQHAGLVSVGKGVPNTQWPPITFRPGGILSGRITTAAGVPVAGALVTLSDGLLGRSRSHSAVSDSDGNYRIHGVATGDYTPFVSPPDGVDLAGEFSGNASSPASATPIHVTAGATTTYGAVLEPGGHFSGTVSSLSGLAAPYALSVYTRDGALVANADAFDGHYRTPALRPGTYLISAREDQIIWWHGRAWRSQTSVPVTMGAADKPLTIRVP